MSPEEPRGDPELAVARLVEMSVDLRSCAILDSGGRLLAASRPGGWEGHARELWEAAEATGSVAPEQVHVADERGELFAVRAASGIVIALTNRFALASLMFCDLRAALRELAGEAESSAGAGSSGVDGGSAADGAPTTDRGEGA